MRYTTERDADIEVINYHAAFTSMLLMRRSLIDGYFEPELRMSYHEQEARDPKMKFRSLFFMIRKHIVTDVIEGDIEPMSVEAYVAKKNEAGGNRIVQVLSVLFPDAKLITYLSDDLQLPVGSIICYRLLKESNPIKISYKNFQEVKCAWLRLLGLRGARLVRLQLRAPTLLPLRDFQQGQPFQIWAISRDTNPKGGFQTHEPEYIIQPDTDFELRHGDIIFAFPTANGDDMKCHMIDTLKKRAHQYAIPSFSREIPVMIPHPFRPRARSGSSDDSHLLLPGGLEPLEGSDIEDVDHVSSNSTPSL